MSPLQLVIAAGLFSLGGVVLGALMSPLTQLFLERTREQRAAKRAKLLVAGELLHAEFVLRTAAKLENWPPIDDSKDFLPASVWQENRASIVTCIDENLYNRLVMAYAILDIDRTRFIMANRFPAKVPLPTEIAKGVKEFCDQLGGLRRELGGGGGWIDEIPHELK
jgi:hypothetical protein